MKIVAPLIVLTAMLLGLPLLGAVLAAIVVPCHFGKGYAFYPGCLGSILKSEHERRRPRCCAH